MFPPVFPIYIPALSPLHEFATLIWLGGVVCLWLTRYTHQLGQRWGTFYYALSVVVRPVGILLIGVGWMALYAPDYVRVESFGWLPRGNWADVLCWIAIGGFFALGVWSVVTLGVRQSFLFRRVEDPLIIRGPYRLVRHPQFLSVIGMTFFVIRLFDPRLLYWSYDERVLATLLDANWALFAVALWVLSILEEQELQAHFGKAYMGYARWVPRLFPN